MDAKRTGSKDSIVSSLTESWNIVETNDVTDTIEGSSDGESIEVIDEDANNQEAKKNKKEGANIEDLTNTESNEDIDENDEEEEDSEISVTPSQIVNITSYVPIINRNSFCNLINRNYNDFNVRKALAMMTFAIIILTSFICAIITMSALMNAHTIAVDIIDYISTGSFKRVRNNQRFEGRELHGVVDRLSSCELNVFQLRTSVNDLRDEVQQLKNELEFALRFTEDSALLYDRIRKFELSHNEKKLFKELFGIHMAKYPAVNILKDEINFNDGREVKMLLEMIRNSTSGLERESNVRDVHLFNLIPQQLALLTQVNSTNKHVEFFINNWKNKFEDMNVRVLEDHKEIQLRMIRQLMKHMRSTYSKFHDKLCILIGFTDSLMCNELKKYLEQISMSHSKANHPNTGESSTSEDGADKKQPASDPPTGKTPINRFDKQSKKIRKNAKDDRIADEEKIYTENNEIHPKQTIKLKNIKKHHHDRKCTEAPANEQIKSFNPKLTVETKEELGMNNDLKSDSSNNDQINSFSSFSNGQGAETETGCPERTKKESWQRQKEMLTGQQSSDAAESSWFLNIGNQRSKLRTSEALSDWLFERARYRSTHKP